MSNESIESILRAKGVPEEQIKEAVEIVLMHLQRKEGSTVEQAVDFVMKWVELNNGE